MAGIAEIAVNAGNAVKDVEIVGLSEVAARKLSEEDGSLGFK